MQLDDTDIQYLIKQAQHCRKKVEDKETQGWMTYLIREQACILLLNLAEYNWDNKKQNAYQLTQKEERKYYSASTTNSTAK